MTSALYLKALRRQAAEREVAEADRVWHEECGGDDGDALARRAAALPRRAAFAGFPRAGPPGEDR